MHWANLKAAAAGFADPEEALASAPAVVLGDEEPQPAATSAMTAIAGSTGVLAGDERFPGRHRRLWVAEW